MYVRLAHAFVWLYVFTVPWQNTVVIPGVGTLARAAGVLAALAVGLTALARRRYRVLHPFLVMASAFVAWSGLSTVWSIDPGATIARTLTYLQLLVASWVIWEATRNGQQLRGLLQAYVLGGCISTVAVFASYVTGVTPYYARYVAPGFDPNDLGLTLALGLPMATYLLAKGSRKLAYQAFNVIYILGVLPTILLTASRTAAAVIGLEMLASGLLLLRLGRWHRTLPLAIVGIGAVVLLVNTVVPSASIARVSTLSEEITEGTLNQRTVIWAAGWNVWRDHPIVGVGAGGFRYAVEPTLGRERAAHNILLGVLVDGGLLGLLLYALFFAVVVGNLRVTPGAERLLWIVVLGGLLMGGMALSWEHHKVTWLLVSLAACQTTLERVHLQRGRSDPVLARLC